MSLLTLQITYHVACEHRYMVTSMKAGLTYLLKTLCSVCFVSQWKGFNWGSIKVVWSEYILVVHDYVQLVYKNRCR